MGNSKVLKISWIMTMMGYYTLARLITNTIHMIGDPNIQTQ